jgi:DegV family protein with EDD domain
VIRIVTDSSADLPSQIVASLEISVVPLTIRFGSEEYVDGRDLTPDAFWSKLEATSSLPETAAPSAGTFLDTFEALGRDGADGVFVICMSSSISATYQSAVIAAEQASVPVRVADSRVVSMALGLRVIAAARAARDGADLEALVTAEQTRRSNVYAALDTLEFLRRGGRVGGASALIGGLLDIKPIIEFSDGAVAAAGRVRTRAKAMKAVVDKAVSLEGRLDALAVIHGNAPDVGNLVDALAQALPGVTPTVAQLGPVVGTHSGPGAIGIAYLER